MTELRDIKEVSLAAGRQRVTWKPRRRLWHCRAMSRLTGSFGDYVWALDKAEAKQAFEQKHRLRPFSVEVER